MQYKSSCVRSFQIRLKLFYSLDQKAQKDSRKTGFFSVHSNVFHGILNRINTELDACCCFSFFWGFHATGDVASRFVNCCKALRVL